MQRGLKILLMAGGKGTRLWPKSRISTPKQFMSLKPQKTLFQQSVQRVSGLTEHAEIFVVAPPEYVSLINQQAPELSSEHIIVEPCQHGTTACLGYALMYLQSHSLKPKDIVLVLPTDAFVDDDESFRNTLLDVLHVANETNGTVTVGVSPSSPETGFGYLEASQERVGPGIKVEKFFEKPCRDDAINYVQSGNFYWNTGIFAWSASTISKLFETHLPDCYSKLLILKSLFAQSDLGAIRGQYTLLPRISFEYAIVEKAAEIFMVPARFNWDDLWFLVVTYQNNGGANWR